MLHAYGVDGSVAQQDQVVAAGVHRVDATDTWTP
jgi:hypothetical protein